ncbi:MAG: serine/threonine-protein kinase [Polyangiaceae bacterium]
MSAESASTAPTTAPTTGPLSRLYEPGELVGRWKVLGELGRGGLGVVYDVEHSFTGKRGALKIIKAATGKHARVLADKMEHEAQLLSRLRHPHLVEVYDAGHDEQGQIWMVMERLVGSDLEAVLRRDGKLEPDRALRYAEAVASATAVVHQAGVIHRDLKPDNIHISETDVVKVIDFGTARYRQGATLQGQTVGTIPYMSPEHLRGAELDGRTDVFALGIVLWEMLGGRHPFQIVEPDGTVRWPPTSEVIPKMLLMPVPSLETEVGAEVWALLERATRKDRDARFEDMASFAAAIARVREPHRQIYAPTSRLSAAEMGLVSSLTGAPSPSAAPSAAPAVSGVVATAAMSPSAAARIGALGTPAPVAATPPAQGASSSTRRVPLLLAGVFGAVALITGIIVMALMGGGEASETAASGEGTAAPVDAPPAATTAPEAAPPAEALATSEASAAHSSAAPSAVPTASSLASPPAPPPATPQVPPPVARPPVAAPPPRPPPPAPRPDDW